MAYASVADLTLRHDPRLINDLSNDEGVRQSRGDLQTNSRVVTALSDASGAVTAALVVGDRYSVTDLESLTGDDQSLLKRIVCDIAMSFLYDRRPSLNADEYERYNKMAERHLNRLRKGDAVFNIKANRDATKVTLDGPTTIDYNRLNLLPERVPRTYPSRSSRLPTDRR